MSKRPRNSFTLNDLVVHLKTISKEHPELMGEPVEIHFDSGCFREINGVAVNPISKRVVISEDFIESSSFK
jgi:hypothetical protein